MKKVWRRILTICTAVLLLAVSLPALPAEAEGSYGADAYAYMEYLQGNYPGRAVGTATLEAAGGWLKQEIANMGYYWEGQPFTVNANGTAISGENIIFSKDGASDQVIVVGAHYDCVAQTNGTDDNATGVGVLLESAKRLASASELPYTVRFILFSAEEPGCYGSQYYVDTLSQEERDRIVCMINIDTIGAGDYMYLYGGGVDGSGQPVRTWAVEQALSAAGTLGLHMSYHPDVNPQYPVPVKNTASDQQGFDRAGIPYIYFEASNWNGADYNNIYQTSNPAVVNGKMLHVAEYENLPFYTQTFGNRIAEHLTAYSALLDYLLKHLAGGQTAVALQYEERDERVWAISDVNIRTAPSVNSEVLTVLKAGESVQRTGYHEQWSVVNGDWGTAYIKTEYLTTEEPETEPPATEEQTAEEQVTETESLTEEPETAVKEPETASQPEDRTEPAESEPAEKETSFNWLPSVIAIVIVAAGGGLAFIWYRRKKD